MQYISIKDNVYRAILWPTLITTAFLSISLASLYSISLKNFSKQRAEALSHQLSLVIEASEQKNPELIEGMFSATLHEPDIRALLLLDAESRIIYQVGPTPVDLQNIVTDNDHQFQAVGAGELYVHPVQLQTAMQSLATEPGSLVIEFIHAPYELLHTQTAIIALLALIIGAVIAFSLALKLSNRISAPLLKVQTLTQKLSQGELQHRLDDQDELELKPLVTSFNSMADNLEQAHQDMQNHIEQSTEDLRETLETIEEQNIELNFARKEAVQASRVKSEFLANTSHEIRTPLNGIIGFSQLALKTPINNQQEEYLTTILESSQGLLSVINDIIDFSKLDSGKLNLDHIPLALNQCVEEVLLSLSSEAQRKHQELITLFSPDLPLNLLGDPLRFKQVLSNLVSNAIKFSDAGNIIIQLQKLSISDNRLELKVTVSDSGVGLSENQQKHIFQAFSQADASDTRQHSGTGLGLAICKGLVQHMRGNIGVSSEQGQGSSFWFSCQLGINSKVFSPAKRLNFTAKRIACLSTNTMARLQACTMLEQLDCELTELDDIDLALDEVASAHKAQQGFELLLIDMPYDLNSDQLQNLKKLIWQSHKRYNVHILVAAGTEQQKRLADAELSTIIQFITKPIFSETLRLGISQTLNSNTIEEVVTTQASRKKPRVLVVDDNPANRKLAAELLKGLQVDTHCADSGKTALEALESEKFGLVFMDLQMPVMDGMAATKAWRKREQQEGLNRTPIVALTAHAMEEKRAELLLAGMDDFISKPISDSQLKHLLKRWLKHDARPQPPSQTKIATGQSKPLNQNPEIVDIQECLKLSNQKSDLAKDMLSMLIDSLEADQAAIQSALDQGNLTSAQEVIHKLYGSSCYCGVPSLREISGKADKALQKHQSGDISSELQELVDNTFIEMNKLLDWNKTHVLDDMFQTKVS